jgi:glycosyltransferase involved in cell wall biosynthesis
MLRVAHVIDSLNLGGTETQCVALVLGLAARGVENRVFHNRPGPLRERLDVTGVTVAHVPNGGFLRPTFPGHVVRLARAFAAWRPHVVQTYGFYTNLPGLLAGRLARVPVLVGSKRGYDPHLSAAQRRVDRWARRLAHATVVNTAALRAWLAAEELARGVVLIPNCVSERTAVVPPGEPVVGMVANFVPPKDHETFLRAAAIVARDVPEARFRLVGEGPNEPAMRALADTLGLTPRVAFLGRLTPAAVAAALDGFAVSVLSSASEGMPNAVLEAMLAARPVVATDVAGMREVVQHDVTGALVPPRDPDALAAAVTRLLKDPARAAAMGAAGRRHVLDAHGVTRMVEDFLRLWRGLGAEAPATQPRQPLEVRA